MTKWWHILRHKWHLSAFITLFLSQLAMMVPVVALAQTNPCEARTIREKSYAICIFTPADTIIRTHWKADDGSIYGGLSPFASAMQAKGETLIMAMNGGMYHQDMRPVGLFVEAGDELAKISTSCGKQNFNLCPNGVFWIKDGKPVVTETRRYRRRNPKPDFATQSGPMLVIEGQLHPRFQAQSDSRKIRNGVGARKDGTLVFAISNDYVSFYEFAVVFRDDLQTPNALFLDGTISSLHAPSLGRADSFWPVGPIISVAARKPPEE
jgi:uncharacterized protein YigE (DUF2233 family)